MDNEKILAFIYGFGLLGGFCVALSGIHQLDGKRHRLGAALVGFGFLMAISSSALFLCL